MFLLQVLFSTTGKPDEYIPEDFIELETPDIPVIITSSLIVICPLIADAQPIIHRFPITVLPAIPVHPAIAVFSPIITLCPICT